MQHLCNFHIYLHNILGHPKSTPNPSKLMKAEDACITWDSPHLGHRRQSSLPGILFQQVCSEHTPSSGGGGLPPTAQPSHTAASSPTLTETLGTRERGRVRQVWLNALEKSVQFSVPLE